MIRIFLLLIFFTSCQDYNSNTADRAKYGPVVLSDSDPNFSQAFSIIQNRCVNCHSSSIHDNWASLQDNNAWIDTGLIQRQSPETSYFVQRIINYGGTSSNMPQGGTPLPDAEYQHLLKWIDEMP